MVDRLWSRSIRGPIVLGRYLGLRGLLFLLLLGDLPGLYDSSELVDVLLKHFELFRGRVAGCDFFHETFKLGI